MSTLASMSAECRPIYSIRRQNRELCLHPARPPHQNLLIILFFSVIILYIWTAWKISCRKVIHVFDFLVLDKIYIIEEDKYKKNKYIFPFATLNFIFSGYQNSQKYYYHLWKVLSFLVCLNQYKETWIRKRIILGVGRGVWRDKPKWSDP